MLSDVDLAPRKPAGHGVWFDNGPVTRFGDEVMARVRKLGFKGCEVLQIKMTAFKAVILVDGPGLLVPEFQEQGFAGVDWDAVRVCWRVEEKTESQGEASD